MDKLPIELIYQILLKTSFEDLKSAQNINNITYNICNNPNFWIDKGIIDFGTSKEIMIMNNPYLQYQILMIDRLIMFNNVCNSFFKAGMSGNSDVINYYVKSFHDKYDVNLSIITGAAFAGHKDIAINLINKITKDFDYNYAIMAGIEFAIKGGNLDVVIHLINLLDDVKYWFVTSSIVNAIQSNNLRIVKYLTGKEDVPLPEAFYKKMSLIYAKYGDTNCDLINMLIHAIKANNFEIVEYILDDLIRPNITCDNWLMEKIIDISRKNGTPEITHYIKNRLPGNSVFTRLFNYFHNFN